jgi:hypothetical protein
LGFVSVFCVLSQIYDLGSHRGNTAQTLIRWQHLVAISEALDVLNQAMITTPHCRIHMTIKTASNCGVFIAIKFIGAHNHR